MIRREAKKRIEKLKKVIDYHRYLYHVLDKQEISEPALDSLKKELFDLEQKFPEFITPDSPTQRIGGKPLEKFKKTRHPEPMLSFNDAFSEKDVEDWQERIKKLLIEKEREDIGFFCELKIDGLAIELIYKENILKTGSTRGDGVIGEDITQNLKTIEAIPLRLRSFNHFSKKEKELFDKIQWEKSGKELVVRGEVFISKREFDRLNKEQKKIGLSSYANPRNVAAGSIRQLDPKITAKRKLNSYTYELINDLGQKTHEEKHKILKTFGFKVNFHNKYCKNLKEVFKFYNFVQKELRDKLPYEIDGVLVIVNSNKIFKKLGVAGKAPRGAVAYKFSLKQATARILDIKVQVGRTGALTPVAVLSPVRIGGTTVSRATLHNEDEIKKLGVKIGDTVIVGRAGDVIPDIIKVLPELRTGKEKNFQFPQKCPVCNAKTVRLKGEAITRCANQKCFARQKKYFYHFVQRKAFNIEGLGPKIINQLIEQRLVSDPADLFELKDGDLVFLERFAEKSSQNLVRAIQSRKKITLSRFIYALGIRNAGEKTANDLVKHFGSLEKLQKASPEDLEKIIDIGPVVAKSIYEWFQEKNNLELLEKLKRIGIEVQYQKPRIKNLKLKGKTIVLTGGLEIMTRAQAKEKIRDLGGEISETVSKNTDFVIIGESPGSKFKKAKKLGIKIIKEKELLKLIEN